MARDTASKKNYKYIIITIIIIVLLLIAYIIYIQSTTSLLDNNNNTNIDNKETYYDCTFTKTYRVVELLNNYVAEVPEESFIVLDSYQTHSAFTHRISIKEKEKLKENNYYEFTYHLKGIGVINDMEDVRNNISSSNLIKSDNSLKVLVEIKETNKEGLEQIQENICR